MSEVFADTGYWIALIDRGDQGHEKALEVSGQIAEQQVVTTEMVLTELLNSASGRGEYLRKLTADTCRQLYHRRNVEVIPQTSNQFHSALQRYLARLDHNWSLVDCASFIVMETRQIHEALAFDHHFEQAGFTALLRD